MPVVSHPAAPGAWTVTVYTGGKRLHKDVEVTAGLTEVTVG